MPPTLPINLANFPALRTRKALLVLDFQDDFLSPTGALPVSFPNGYVDRTLNFAKAFRDSSSGDVFWIQSQFQAPRPMADAHIITSSEPTQVHLRGRQRPSPRSATGSDEDGDNDNVQDASREAFLTGTHRALLVPGSSGAEMPPAVTSAVDTRRDVVLVKSHYSAFESTQLLMRLRTRLITELFICVEDCCGYRSAQRHASALTNIAQLTGCDIVLAQDLLQSLPPPQPLSSGQPTDSFAAAIAAITAASTGPPRARRSTKQASTGPVGFAPVASSGASLPVRTKLPGRRDIEEGRGGKKEEDATESKEYGKNVEEACQEEKERGKGKKIESDDIPPPQSQTPTLRRSPFTAHSLPISVTKKAQSLQPLVVGAASDPMHGTTLVVDPTHDRADTSDSPPALLLQENHRGYSGLQPEYKPNDIKRHLQEAAKASAAYREQRRLASGNSTSGLSTGIVTKQQDRDDRKEMASQNSASLSDQADLNEGAKSGAESGLPLTSVDTTKHTAATEPICEGDTIVYHNVLPREIEDGVYERLRDEVHWLRMSHNGGEVPRLVCVQGDISKDRIPVYRHPADESPPLEPFSPTVLQIKKETECIVGHPLNHVLIQLYRTGNDYISEHSDKTLDIAPGSYVCNLSLGAERTMTFRTKRVAKDLSRQKTLSKADADQGRAEGEEARSENSKANTEKRQAVRVQLPHNSLCRMGLRTNMRWLHAIRQDKRPDRDRTPAELAFGAERISLTFRQIGTFLDHDQTVIWGQGAVAKTRDAARPVINGQTEETVRMLRAFGMENHSSVFDWNAHYGGGFDVLHMSNAPRLFASVDAVVNLSIQLLLSDLGIACAKGSMSGPPTAVTNGDTDTTGNKVSSHRPILLDLPVRLVDNDRDRSTVSGFLAILLYLDKVYGRAASASPSDEARRASRLQQALVLQGKWRSMACVFCGANNPPPASPVKAMKAELAVWERYILPLEGETRTLGSSGGGDAEACLADFVFWPVLHSMEQALSGAVGSKGGASLSTELVRLGLPNLAKYYRAFGARESVMRVCAAEGELD